jgi:uncharacterized repeat protein (TIGR03803 family)
MIIRIVAAITLCWFSASAYAVQPTILASFGSELGRYPQATLLHASDGNFYGTTERDGAGGGQGAIFRFSPDGTLSLVASFNGANGSAPLAALVEGSDGRLYGTTSAGGVHGLGTIFRVTLDGQLTSLASFDGTNGSAPDTPLVEAPDGSFLGTSPWGGPGGAGNVFRLTPAGQLEVLVSFHFSNGGLPRGLVAGDDQWVYGTTEGGGTFRNGVAFRLKYDGSRFEKLASFSRDLGCEPNALMRAPDGNFYGTTHRGAGDRPGTLFRMSPRGTVTVLAKLVNFSNPVGAMILGKDGKLYGIHLNGSGVFRTSLTGEVEFVTRVPPQSRGLVADDDKFLLTTPNGSSRVGAILRLNGNSGVASEVATFDAPLGFELIAGVAEDGSGAWIGSNLDGGAHHAGTLFSIRDDGTFQKLSDFNYDGPYGETQLTAGPDGALFGVSLFGRGDNQTGSGAYFRLGADGTMDVLAYLSGDLSSYPNGLMLAPDGNFYGTTQGGFELPPKLLRYAPAGAVSIVAELPGQQPVGRLALAGGRLYGVDWFGKVFRSTFDGQVTVFANVGGGLGNLHGLTADVDDSLYGTGTYDGAHRQGTLFRVTPDDAVVVVHTFDAASDEGGYPWGPLLRASDGNFYGTTRFDDATSGARVFAYSPRTGKVSIISRFAVDDGGISFASLVQGANGNLYGTGGEGGRTGGGTVFRLPGPPSIPVGVTAQAVAQGIEVSWTPAARAARYDVYLGTRKGHAHRVLRGVTGTQATLGQLTPGQSYWISVSAVNAVNETMPSPEVKAIPLAARAEAKQSLR